MRRQGCGAGFIWRRTSTNHSVCLKSYHTPSTLLSMRRYRIGTLSGPWRNKVPTIRGGVFENPYKTTLDSEKTLHEDLPRSDNIIPNGATTKSQGKHEAKDYAGTLSAPAPSRPQDATTRNFIEKTIKEEIDSDLLDYPPVDVKTQQEIEARYKLLHQRVRDEGFYECPYVEYAKEVARYAFLFTLFLIALQYKWYCSSAAMLGLFWVSCELPFNSFHNTHTDLASNHVHCPRCRTSRHHSQLRI